MKKFYLSLGATPNRRDQCNLLHKPNRVSKPSLAVAICRYRGRPHRQCYTRGIMAPLRSQLYPFLKHNMHKSSNHSSGFVDHRLHLPGSLSYKPKIRRAKNLIPTLLALLMLLFRKSPVFRRPIRPTPSSRCNSSTNSRPNPPLQISRTISCTILINNRPTRGLCPLQHWLTVQDPTTNPCLSNTAVCQQCSSFLCTLVPLWPPL